MNEPQIGVDAYLAGVAEPARSTLEGLRGIIKAAAPDAVETMGYGMPAYKLKGRPLVYFSAAKNHCAVYGLDSDVAEQAGFDTSHKGTIRFPPSAPPPETLVRQLLDLRMAAIDAALAGRRKRKASRAAK